MDKTEKMYTVTVSCVLSAILIGFITKSVNDRSKRFDPAIVANTQQLKQKEIDTFKALSPQEHLKLATAAFKEEKYLEMDRHLSAVDISYPGVKELKKQYLAHVNEEIKANSDRASKEYKKLHKQQLAENKLKVPTLGMDSETLYECSWGIPDHINRTKTAFGTSEQWAYEGRGKLRCVYLENNVVTAIQD